MNIIEYAKIKNYTYSQYCDYLLEKYGPAKVDYFNENYVKIKEVTRTEEGLFCHHMKENEAPNLSNPDIARLFPFEYQEKHNLVYCNWLEHIFLHLLIAQENAESGLGINGANLMLREVEELYEGKEITLTWVQNCFDVIEEYFDVFEELLKRRDDRSILLEHNTVVYSEMVETLERDNKTVVVIGTGGGKTTTALQYLRDFGIRGLVLAPTKIIVDGWKTNPEVDVITHAKFRNSYEDIDYSKYGVVICDEAHHVTSETVTGKALKYVIDNELCKVIGLTAEEKKSDGKKVADDMYDGNICEGITVLEGIKEGILHPFSYVGAIYDRDKIRDEFKDLEDLILRNQLDLALNNTPELKEILTSNMPSGPRKGIIFVSRIDDIPETLDIMRDIYPDVEYRWIHSRQSDELNETNKKWFRDTNEGYLISINMISEGAHYRGVNTLIMFRRTESPLVFNQQLGRLVTLTKYEDPNGIVFDLVNNSQNVAYGDGRVRIKLKEELREYIERNKGGKSDALIVKDYTEDVVEILEQIRESQKRIRAVYQIDDNLEIIKKFNTISETREDGFSPSAVASCCKRQHARSGGYYWCFVEDYSDEWLPKESRFEMNQPLYCLQLDRIFENAITASEITGINAQYIRKASVGLAKTAGGMNWCKAKDKDSFIPPINEGEKAVVCVNTGVKYSTIKEASEKTGAHSSAIVRCCKGEQKTANKLTWVYLENFKPGIKTNEGRGERVVCVNTGKYYESISEAARQTGINRGAISQACNGRVKTAGGYTWAHEEDYNIQTKINQKFKRQGKSVRCIETNIIYESAREASEATGIKASNIRRVCSGENKTSGGFHWEYVD